jgi:hypothetical protein
VKYLPLFHHFKVIYQFPKHIIFLVKIVANASLREYDTVGLPIDFFMKICDLVNFDMLFPNMQRIIYLRDLVFEIFTIEFRPFFDKFLK